VRYGGNTSCVEMRTDSGLLIILDCGTGARELGMNLLANAGGSPLEVHLFIGHTHWDHIQGFPFFTPAFIPGVKLHVYGPGDSQSGLSGALSGQMQYTYFPVNLDQLGASIHYTGLSEGEFTIGDVKVRAQYLNHPAVTLGYRFDVGGLSVVYSTDHEPFSPQLYRSDSTEPSSEAILHEGDRRHAAFLADADLVIHDAQYTDQEYEKKHTWGHSTMSYVTELSRLSGVKRLALFHHDPTHDDAFLDREVGLLRGKLRSDGSVLQLEMAAEGREILLAEVSATAQPAAAAGGGAAAAPVATERPVKVLVIEDDALASRLLVETLRSDGYDIETAYDGRSGLGLIRSSHPDLVLIDLGLPVVDGLTVIGQVRKDPDIAGTLMVVLTGQSEETAAQASFAAGANDYLVKPFSPALVRARIRGWLSRTGMV